MKRKYEKPRPLWKPSQRCWARSNFGVIQGTGRTRAELIAEIEADTGKPWSEAKAYMEVWKCTIVPRID